MMLSPASRKSAHPFQAVTAAGFAVDPDGPEEEVHGGEEKAMAGEVVMRGHHVRGSDQADRQGGIDHEDVEVAVVIGGQDAGSPDRQVFASPHVQTEDQVQERP